MTKNLVIRVLPLITLFLSCRSAEQETVEEKHSYEIYNLLLSKYNYEDFKPVVPPPPSKFTNEFSENDYFKLADSLKKTAKTKKLSIGLNPVLVSDESYGKVSYKEYKEFNPLLEKMKTIAKDSVELGKLKYDNKKISLKVLDSENFSENKRAFFKEYDLYLTLSRVVFNDNHTKAVVSEGFLDTPMEGHSSLFFLVRNNDKWKILYSSGP